MSKLSVTMLGTGIPRVTLERFPSAQVLLIDDLPILVDCGEGAAQQLLNAGVAPENVKHLWLTHLHSDHVLGYGRFLIGGWGAGRRELTVYGPKGTKKFHQLMLEMFEDDIKYRMSLGRPANGIYDVQIIEVEHHGMVPCDIPAKVTTQSMIHNVPTFAYRFQIGEKAVVFSGDTAPTNRLVELSKGADLLVHDANLCNQTVNRNPEFEKIRKKLEKEHCTPAQAADTAREAGVKKLILTHLPPHINVDQVYQEASERFSGTVIVPNDLDDITID